MFTTVLLYHCKVSVLDKRCYVIFILAEPNTSNAVNCCCLKYQTRKHVKFYFYIISILIHKKVSLCSVKYNKPKNKRK